MPTCPRSNCKALSLIVQASLPNCLKLRPNCTRQAAKIPSNLPNLKDSQTASQSAKQQAWQFAKLQPLPMPQFHLPKFEHCTAFQLTAQASLPNCRHAKQNTCQPTKVPTQCLLTHWPTCQASKLQSCHQTAARPNLPRFSNLPAIQLTARASLANSRPAQLQPLPTCQHLVAKQTANLQPAWLMVGCWLLFLVGPWLFVVCWLS